MIIACYPFAGGGDMTKNLAAIRRGAEKFLAQRK